MTPAAAKTESPPWVVGSLREVAEFFGVSNSTVKTDWKSKGLIPSKRPAGGYDLSEIFQAWRDRDRRNELAGTTGRKTASNGGDGNALLIDKLRRQVEKLSEEARKLRRENRLEEAELVERSAVEQYLTQWAVRFRTPLERLADQIANRVPGPMKASVKTEVAEEVHSALRMVLDLKPTERRAAELICEEADRIRTDRPATKTNGRHKVRT